MQRVISDTLRPVKIWASDLEPEAEAQVRNMASLPFIHRHVAVMPDAHAGKGSTVGTVIATKGAIIPSAVGVDIGCGMMALELPFDLDRIAGSQKLKNLRSTIEAAVPVGRGENQNLTETVHVAMNALGDPSIDGLTTKAAKQLGSLGGGNHFIEVCGDERGKAWIVLHSGSRHIGKRLADIHINEAKGLMKKLFIDLPHPDLAYLAQGTEEFKAYIRDLHWAQDYAAKNRIEMLRRVVKAVSQTAKVPRESIDLRNAINCHHNYTTMENHFGANVWVTRKGAVSAKQGELGIIPGSMGTRSYIVEGLGNPQSFCSCSHGAGRKMSRTKAMATFTQADVADQTIGVECRKDEGVIDEIPGAYKNIDEVMANQADLVKPVRTLKQVLCVKG